MVALARGDAVDVRHRIVLTPEGDGAWWAWCRGCSWQRSGTWDLVRREQRLHTRDEC